MIALPAFRGLLFKAAGGAAPDIVYIANNTGNISSTRSPTITGPTAEVNDILICAIVTDVVHLLNTTLPTGWCFIDSQAVGTDSTLSTFWKRVTTAGADSFTWTDLFTANQSGVWAVTAYRNCVSTGSPLGNIQGGTGAFSSTWINTLNTTEVDSMVVSVFGADQTAGASFTWSSTATVERVDVANGALGYVTIGERPAATTGTYALSGLPSTADSYAFSIFELLKTNPSSIKYIDVRRNFFNTVRTISTVSPVAEVDDILILVVSLDTAATLTDGGSNLPTGWNFLNLQTYITEHTTCIFWKRVTTAGADSSTWTNLFADTEVGVWTISVYRGCTTSGSPFANITTGGFASTTTWSVPITSSTANSTCLAIFGADASTGTLFNWSTSGIRERIDYNYPAANLGYITMGDLYTPTTGTYVLSGTVSLTAPYTRFGCELIPQ